MTPWKLPPNAKIYEALSAVADGRVILKGDNWAEVASSDRTKTYKVEWTNDLSQITANDNASFYQGYMGYPMIAVLMKIGKLTCDENIAGQLAGIPWKELNTKFKNKYDRAIDFVFNETLAAKGVDRTVVDAQIDLIMQQLEEMQFQRLPKRVPPPKER